jgi:hypothetical protein
MKRDGKNKMDMDAKEDLLARRTAARQELIDNIEDILNNPDFNQEEETQQQLINTVRTYILTTGQDLNHVRPGAPSAPTMFDPRQSPDIVISGVVKRVAAGEPTKLSKQFFEGLAKIFGERDRKPGETVESARSRYHQTPEGRLLREAAKRAPVIQAEVAKRIPERGPAVMSLWKRAAEIGPTREKGVAKLAESCDPLWKAAVLEEKARAVAAA